MEIKVLSIELSVIIDYVNAWTQTMVNVYVIYIDSLRFFKNAFILVNDQNVSQKIVKFIEKKNFE